MLIPTIIDRDARGERAWDIFSRLLKDRIVFIGTGIDDMVASIVIAQLLYLEKEDAEKDIDLYVNSPGGYLHAGLAIYDTMQTISPDVATICIGQAASAAALLLAGGARGKRYALPYSRILIHQPWGGAQGQVTDIEITAREYTRLKQETNQILARHTGQTPEKISQDTERDYWMSAQQALEYGIVDKIMTKDRE